MAADERMPHGIDTTMQPVKAASSNTRPHRARWHTEPFKLGEGDYSVLTRSKLRDDVV
jgi:hypothetical protein